MLHYDDVIMGTLASQITCLTVYSGADQRKYQSSASLAFVRRIHRSPVNSPHKGPVTRKMLPFDDVIRGNFQRHFNDKYLNHFLWNWSRVNATRPRRRLIRYIGSGNGSVPSDNKPLHESMLIRFYVATWCQYGFLNLWKQKILV